MVQIQEISRSGWKASRYGQQTTSKLQVPWFKVRVGHGKIAAARGLHSSGFEEVMVFNQTDLETINPETQAARIGASVETERERYP